MAEPQSAEPEPTPLGLFDEWITRNALGEELGVSIDTLARWETRRTGPPCVRIGRKVMYRIEAVREWLVQQESRRPAARAERLGGGK